MKRPLVMYVSPNPDAHHRFEQAAAEHFQNRIQIITAVNGDEGKRRYESMFGTGFHFAVAIAEEQLPGMSGVEFLIHVSRDFPEARTVLLASSGDMAMMQKAKNLANLYRYLPQPWDVYQIINATTQAMRSYVRYIELMEYTDLLQDLNQSAQEISSELNPVRLNDTLLSHLLENSGADIVYLILEKDYELHLAALNARNPDRKKELLQAWTDLPKRFETGLLARLNESIKNPESFGNRKVAPILKQKRRLGYVFAELEEPEDFFSEAQEEGMLMMASQFAISLENIELYQQLESQQAQLTHNNAVLQEKVDDIMASMRYAQRIQAAMLPSTGLLNAYFPSTFLLYQTCELVSGDFYWFAELNGNVLVAVADCTGRGVPGAFMSVITNNFLNQAVNEFGITEPAAVLEFVDSRIRSSLKQEQPGAGLPDTVEVALCLYEIENQTLVFSGANRPLVLIRGDQMMVANGNPRVVGGAVALAAQQQPENRVFRAKQLRVEAGDLLYLFTAGVQNLCGPNRGSYGESAFFHCLYTHRGLPLHEQREALATDIAQWLGGESLSNDLLVLGFGF